MIRLSSSSRGRRARFGVVFSAFLAAQSLVAPVVFAQDAKTQLGAGDKAAQSKDWAGAASAYEAANKASPSDAALDGLANAHYQMKHDADAYAAYDEWLKTYGAKNAAKKKTNEARLKELADRTGTLEIASNEAGASVSVDDKHVGKTPLPAPLRLGLGPHRVRVVKDGFLSFDGTPNVAPNVPNKVEAKLEVSSGKARLSVKEKSGKTVRVFIDGVDMGEAPWVGDVDAGPHEVVVKSPTMAAAPQKVTVEKGKPLAVELEASSSTATVKLSTADGKGLIYIDEKLVGEGQFSGDVPAGSHQLKITRDGYETFSEELALKEKETISRAITLKISGDVSTGAIEKDRRDIYGIYGGFGIPLWLGPGGYGSSVEKACDNKPAELGACDPGSGIGTGIQGFVGFHWDPIGIEFFFGFGYDQVSPKLEWNASSTDPGLGPDPARTEEFTLRRLGGFGAFRVRYTAQTEKIRFSVAGGVGLAYRSLFLTRDATAAQGGGRDAFVPDAQTYLSPLISLEPAIYYRLGGPTAIGVGFAFQMEAAGSFTDNPRTDPDGGRKIGLVGITTPGYELASSTQIFFGPFIGMMFGP